MPEVPLNKDADFISSISEDVLGCLRNSRYFEKLDDLLSPKDESIPAQVCKETFKLSESLLQTLGYKKIDVDDILAVLRLNGACCDCEVLYNAGETSRLKERYWKNKARQNTESGHHPRPK